MSAAMNYAAVVGRDESIVQPAPQTEVVAVIDVVQTTETDSKPKREFNNEVDPDALRLALSFYLKCRDEMEQTTSRSQLAKLFANTYTKTTVEFAVLLFALAKGLRCVNVFNRGQSLEWREPHKQTISKLRKEMKKPIQVKGRFEGEPVTPPAAPKKVETSVPDAPMKPKVAESKKPAEPIRQPVFDGPVETAEDIIKAMASITAEITKTSTEIDELVPFHEQHLRQIARIEQGSQTEMTMNLHKLHKGQADEIADALDAMTANIAALKQQKNDLCDKLKTL